MKLEYGLLMRFEKPKSRPNVEAEGAQCIQGYRSNWPGNIL